MKVWHVPNPERYREARYPHNDFWGFTFLDPTLLPLQQLLDKARSNLLDQKIQQIRWMEDEKDVHG